MFYNPNTNTFLTEADLLAMSIDPQSDKLFERNSLVKLVDTPRPTPGDYQTVVELTPELVGFQFVRRYEVREMFTDPVEIDGVTLTVQEQKDRYLESYLKPREFERLAAERYSRETGGMRFGSYVVDTDRDYQAALMRMAVLAAANPAQFFDVKTSLGWISLNAAEVISINEAMSSFVQDCFAAERSAYELIDAATSIEAARDIVNNSHAAMPDNGICVPPVPTVPDMDITSMTFVANGQVAYNQGDVTVSGTSTGAISGFVSLIANLPDGFRLSEPAVINPDGTWSAIFQDVNVWVGAAITADVIMTTAETQVATLSTNVLIPGDILTLDVPPYVVDTSIQGTTTQDAAVSYELIFDGVTYTDTQVPQPDGSFAFDMTTLGLSLTTPYSWTCTVTASRNTIETLTVTRDGAEA